MHDSRAHRNQARSVVLGVVLVALVLFVASRFGTVGFWIGVVLTLALAGYVFTRSDSVAVRAMHAYPVGEAEQPVLCRVVREMATRARVPVPYVYVSPTRAANALATGRSPARAMICVTEGALDLLDEDELRAVVGHELSHIRYRDTLPASAVGVVSRAVLFVPVVGVLAAGLARLALSRSREFDADRDAVRLTGEPLVLASALRKLDAAARELALPPEPGIVAASCMMIAEPLRPRGMWRAARSHPSAAERVARLEQLAGYRR